MPPPTRPLLTLSPSPPLSALRPSRDAGAQSAPPVPAAPAQRLPFGPRPSPAAGQSSGCCRAHSRQAAPRGGAVRGVRPGEGGVQAGVELREVPAGLHLAVAQHGLLAGLGLHHDVDRRIEAVQPHGLRDEVRVRGAPPSPVSCFGPVHDGADALWPSRHGEFQSRLVREAPVTEPVVEGVEHDRDTRIQRERQQVLDRIASGRVVVLDRQS
mmetsp:Transcript_1720/g.4019  ORF Transcript_1720/g.4019 Transcript_1720/m.4019 type:complete len:212 (+) Transcript_1720:80-715(+)